jgi:signal transduction histidine kinase
MSWYVRFRGLRWRLVLLISLALSPAIIWMVVQGFERRAQADKELRAQTLNLARLAAQEQDRRLEGARQLLIALGNSFRVDDPEECVRNVRALVAEYGDLYSEIGWADRTGHIRCHALDGENLTIADRQYFQQALTSNQFVVGELLIGKISRTPIIAFSHPLRNTNGEVIGVLFANVDLQVLSQSLEGPARKSGGVVTIFDRHGVVAARSHDATTYIGREIGPDQLRVMQREGEVVTSGVDFDGVNRQHATATVRDVDGRPALYVTFGRSEAPLLAATAAMFWYDIMTIALLAVGMIAAALVGAEWLVRRPVHHLLEAAAALGAGRLNTRANPLGSTTEFAALADGFNRMAEQLEQRDVHLREGQRLEAIGQMAGGIAHDFNNLLTIIVGYSAALEEQVADLPDAAHDLAELRKAADRAAALTKQLLIFSRRRMLQPKLFDLNQIVVDMQAMLRRTIGGDIQLDVALESGVDMVRADPTQIEQVIMNLVINARDAIAGGGTITIATRTRTLRADNPYQVNGGEYVVIEVSDTGKGMDAETRRRVFEPFFTTKGQRGTGLGLATVYAIVTQSGGTVRCESAVGRGTRFEVLLPKASGDIVPVPAPAPPAAARGTERVLVVDDEPSVRLFVSSALTRYGYDVCHAEDGVSALAVLDQTRDINLVISDVRMPKMNGLALYEELRKSRPNLPLIFISGDSAPSVKDSRGRQPVFVQKPFTPASLLAAARAALTASAPAAAQ